jgi:hypothetical protein
MEDLMVLVRCITSAVSSERGKKGNAKFLRFFGGRRASFQRFHFWGAPFLVISCLKR